MKAKVKVSIEYLTDSDVSQWVKPKTDLIVGVADITEANEGTTISLAPAADDVPVTITPVNGADLLYILTTENITVKFNADTNDTHTIVADRLDSSSSKYGIYLSTCSGITSLYLSNAGATAATVTLMYFGK